MAVSTVIFIILRSAPLLANGYNRINRVAVPVLVILLALLFPVPALVPAALAFLAVKKIRGVPVPFIRSYIGAVAGEDIGIALSYAISKMSGPGWNSYHYTLYPYIILGLSLAAATACSLAGAGNKAGRQ
ncbi:MAG: hypothetical protein KA369_13500 [Spirochaetes bacterium]|nr:hypothetical protein [Spirochaetota bacterium]